MCFEEKVNYPIQVTTLTSKPYKHKNYAKTWVTLTKEYYNYVSYNLYYNHIQHKLYRLYSYIRLYITKYILL